MEKSRFRQVKRWFDREVFICAKCDDSKDNIGWDYDKKVLFCKTCKYELREKSDLQELLEVTEELKYGFYLRFLGCHFNPCDTCEDKIYRMFSRADRSNFAIHTYDCITMEYYKRAWQFLLRFFSRVDDQTFRPCPQCQKKLNELFTERELHIGNEVKPPVELWRKWELDESSIQ